MIRMYRSKISIRSIGSPGFSSAFVVLSNLRALFCGEPSVVNISFDVRVCAIKSCSAGLIPILGIADGMLETMPEGTPEGIPLASTLIVGTPESLADGLEDGEAEFGNSLEGEFEGFWLAGLNEGEPEEMVVDGADEGETEGISVDGIDDGEGTLTGCGGSVSNLVGEGLGRGVGFDAMGLTNTLRSSGFLLCLLSRARRVSSVLNSQRSRGPSLPLFRSRRRIR